MALFLNRLMPRSCHGCRQWAARISISASFALRKTKLLNDVFVYPMARYSDRIPFGTGPALQKIINEPDGQMKTYSFESFLELKEFFNLRQSFFKQNAELIRQKIVQLHPAIIEFSEQTAVLSEIEDSNQNSATLLAFEKRFFHHFNAFKIIKYLNFTHPKFFPYGSLSRQIENRTCYFESWLFFSTFAPDLKKGYQKKSYSVCSDSIL